MTAALVVGGALLVVVAMIWVARHAPAASRRVNRYADPAPLPGEPRYTVDPSKHSTAEIQQLHDVRAADWQAMYEQRGQYRWGRF